VAHKIIIPGILKLTKLNALLQMGCLEVRSAIETKVTYFDFP